MTTTFERARVGDKVWGMQYGWGVVMNVRDDSDYAIEVNFQDGTEDSFTCDGKVYKENKLQTLFWDEVKIITPKQPQRMKLVHGVDVPDISFTPSHGEGYYCPSTAFPNMHIDYIYRGDEIDTHLLHNKMCYPKTEEGRQAAILHAKAMLGIKE